MKTKRLRIWLNNVPILLIKYKKSPQNGFKCRKEISVKTTFSEEAQDVRMDQNITEPLSEFFLTDSSASLVRS